MFLPVESSDQIFSGSNVMVALQFFRCQKDTNVGFTALVAADNLGTRNVMDYDYQYTLVYAVNAMVELPRRPVIDQVGPSMLSSIVWSITASSLAGEFQRRLRLVWRLSIRSR